MSTQSTTPQMTWHPSADADQLMEQLRNYLRDLSGKLWTNHNPADPGITTAEVLCFAIADLSYRTGFDIKDVLASYSGNVSHPMDLAAADRVLPSAPLTLADLRKVLVDMPVPGQPPGNAPKLLLRNVWPEVARSTERKLFYRPRTATENLGELTFDRFTEEKTEEALIPVPIKGLYALQVEFETDEETTDPHLRDLNQNTFTATVTPAESPRSYRLGLLFPYWDQMDWAFKDVDLKKATVKYQVRSDQQDFFIGVDKINHDEFFYEYYAEVTLNEFALSAYIRQEEFLELSLPIPDQDPVPYTIQWIDWHELSNSTNRDYTQISSIAVGDMSGNISLDRGKRTFDVQLSVTLAGEPDPLLLSARIRFDTDTAVNVLSTSALQSALTVAFGPYDNGTAQLPEAFTRQIALEEAIYEVVLNAQDPVYNAYQQKLKRVFEHLYGPEGVWSVVNKHRNLSEDIFQLQSSRVQELALFGEIIVKPSYAVDLVLAEAYHRVAEFLNPPVQFFTLGEMANKGLNQEEIFNGPLLTHGFIDDSVFRSARNKTVIYTSDLIRLIMEVEGVEAVINFTISSYVDNRVMGRKVIDCLDLTYAEVYKPRLSVSKSGLTATQSDLPAPVNATHVAKQFDVLRLAAKKRQVPTQPYYGLYTPQGNDRQLEAYYSIQHEFPEVYGIGDFGLADEETAERKASAQQFKAFLLPFEQILANYLSQISHLPALFSFDPQVSNTRHFQPLYQVPNMAPLLKPFVEQDQTWEAFKADLDNVYQTFLRDDETPSTFLQRRNQLLDHLLGRFAESFQDYALVQLGGIQSLLTGPDQFPVYEAARQDLLSKLVQDKQRFAEEYELLASERAQAFDITHQGNSQTVWGSENISGYKRRLCRLLGIETVGHQPLFGLQDGNKIYDREGMHIVEHLLLRPRMEGQQLLELNDDPGNLGTYYDAHAFDPYSFRITVVLPRYGGRFQEEGFRNYAEQLIRQETPAHIGVEIQWLDTLCGQQFEAAFAPWLEAMKTVKPYWFAFAPSAADQPQLQAWIDAHNALVDSLQVPCQPEIRALDKEGVRLTETDGMIRFYLGDTDIFFLKSNQPLGRYTIRKTTPEEAEKQIESKKQTEYVGLNDEGLIAQLGGVGEYRIDYESEEQEAFAPILISVTVPPDPRTNLSTQLAGYATYGRIELYSNVNNQPPGIIGLRKWDEFHYDNNTPESALKRLLPNGFYQIRFYERNSSQPTFINFRVEQAPELNAIAEAADPAPPDLVSRVGILPYATSFVEYPNAQRHYTLQHNFQGNAVKHWFYLHPRQGTLTVTKGGQDTIFQVNDLFTIDMNDLEEGTYSAVYDSPGEDPISFSFEWLHEKLDDIRFTRLNVRGLGGGRLSYLVRATMVEGSTETVWKVDGEVASTDRYTLQTNFIFGPDKPTVTVEVDVRYEHLGVEYTASRTLVFTRLDVARF